MSVTSLSFFQVESLRQRFVDDLDAADSAGLISPEESLWLRTLLSRPVPDAIDFPRVDRLVVTDESALDLELATALLISHSSVTNQRIYLNTLFHGLESFDDRKQLLECLEQRHEVIARLTSALEYEEVEGSPFEHRSWVVIDQQAGQLTRASEQLLQLPSLQSALDRALTQQIATLMRGASVDLSASLLQLVETDPATATPYVAGLRTLQQAVLDEFAGKTAGTRPACNILSPQGQVLDADQAELYQRALSGAVQSVSETCEAALADYWSVSSVHEPSRRERLAELLRQVFCLELLEKRHSGLLTRDEFLDLRELVYRDSGTHAVDQVRLTQIAVAIDDRQPVKLAGAFKIGFSDESVSEPLLYSPTQGLRRTFSDSLLNDYFDTSGGRAVLMSHSSLNDHALLQATGVVRVREDEIDQPLFLSRADSLIGLQKRNVAFALAQPRQERSRASVMLDDALDIRRLVDRRLLRISGGGRWSEEATRFDPTGLSARPHHVPGLPPNSQISAAMPWLEIVDVLGKNNGWIRSAHRGIEGWIQDELMLYLAPASNVKLDVQYINVQLRDGSEIPVMESPEPETLSLIALVLESISGHRSVPVPNASQTLFQLPSDMTSHPVAVLTPALLNRMIARINERFAHAYVSQLQHFYNRPLRRIDTQLTPGATACAIRENLLRLELSLQQRLNTIDSNVLSMLEQVLSRPTRALRRSLGDKAVEVYSLSLASDTQTPAALLTNVFILQRSATADGKVLMWSSWGAQAFDSIVELTKALNRRMSRPAQREHLLRLLRPHDQNLVRSALERVGSGLLRVVTERIDDHFIRHLQQIEWGRKYQGVAQVKQWAMRHRLDAMTFAHLLDDAEADDAIDVALDSLSQRIQSTLFTELAPPWLRNASVADLKAFTEIVQRYYLTNSPDRDVMAGIPNLSDYSRGQLRTELKKAFPAYALEPDEITISFKRFITTTGAAALPGGLGQPPLSVPAAVVTHTEHLTDYAINRFSDAQEVVLSVSTSSDSPLPVTLTAHYLTSMVHRLDVGRTFRQLVTQKLDESAADFSTRRADFIRQTPALMLMEAYELKLTEQLSDLAYRFVERVVDMPDGMARLPIDDQDIVLRPIQLIAGEGLSPDTVCGLYLIGPRALSAGPQVLYAIHHSDFMFKEYVDQQALLTDLRVSEDLQAMILERVDPAVRARYADGGFASVHLSWFSQLLPNFSNVLPGEVRPVTLDGSTVPGNALQRFFVDTLSIYQRQIKQRTMTSAEVDRSSFRYLWMLGAEQVLTLVPGKIGLVIAAWQSQTLFREAAQAAIQQRWGKAVSEFTAGLGLLISTKEQSDEGAQSEHLRPEEPESVPESEFSWRPGSLTPDVQNRLRHFEVNAISLSDLERDGLFNLYRDPLTDLRYASVAGKVYQVKQTAEQLCIVSGEQIGPKIKLDATTQQWRLDLDTGLRGGGGIVSSLKSASIDANVDAVFMVEARGMSEIRLLFINKARRIGQAHLQAKRYLEVAMDNLGTAQPNDPLHPEVSRILGDFFGVQPPTAALIAKVRHKINLMFAAMTDPSLSSRSSLRFVTGTNRIGYSDSVAFVFKSDRLRRIYLSENFFRPPSGYFVKTPAPGQVSFDADLHFRALTLIHEVSHQDCDTYDITYVESTAPYLDLLEVNSPRQMRLKAEVEFLQQRTLSHRTQPASLFQTLDANGWRDLTRADGSAKGALLRITGQTSLAGARQVFLTDGAKRADVILSNADSFALLVSLLGRTSYAAPVP